MTRLWCTQTLGVFAEKQLASADGKSPHIFPRSIARVTKDLDSSAADSTPSLSLALAKPERQPKSTPELSHQHKGWMSHRRRRTLEKNSSRTLMLHSTCVKRTCKLFFCCTAIPKNIKINNGINKAHVGPDGCKSMYSHTEPCQITDLKLCSTEVTQPEKPQMTANSA